jgi:hypothetical protein
MLLASKPGGYWAVVSGSGVSGSKNVKHRARSCRVCQAYAPPTSPRVWPCVRKVCRLVGSTAIGYGEPRRQLSRAGSKNGLITGGNVDEHAFEGYVKQALDSAFPGTWSEFLPTLSATAQSDGVGIYISYHEQSLLVATGVLWDLKMSIDLVNEWASINKKIPLGALTLAESGDSWAALWLIRLRIPWFDASSQCSHRMILDVFQNAANMTRLCAESLRLRVGGEPIPVTPGWPALMMSLLS